MASPTVFAPKPQSPIAHLKALRSPPSLKNDFFSDGNLSPARHTSEIYVEHLRRRCSKHFQETLEQLAQLTLKDYGYVHRPRTCQKAQLQKSQELKSNADAEFLCGLTRKAPAFMGSKLANSRLCSQKEAFRYFGEAFMKRLSSAFSHYQRLLKAVKDTKEKERKTKNELKAIRAKASSAKHSNVAEEELAESERRSKRRKTLDGSDVHHDSGIFLTPCLDLGTKPKEHCELTWAPRPVTPATQEYYALSARYSEERFILEKARKKALAFAPKYFERVRKVNEYLTSQVEMVKKELDRGFQIPVPYAESKKRTLESATLLVKNLIREHGFHQDRTDPYKFLKSSDSLYQETRCVKFGGWLKDLYCEDRDFLDYVQAIKMAIRDRTFRNMTLDEVNYPFWKDARDSNTQMGIKDLMDFNNSEREMHRRHMKKKLRRKSRLERKISRL
ncbi:hypothetical protein G7Y89_g2668 [Cudoniella acicularis]|uniref:Uncharacterized protein n=1 Tax=Cudoniella acicularis TaxID=354080 RepID=A0A8H4W954_9HELO|nr:hypothetical protein G7Y89_g2668 [Cudoniella acicularis]